MRRVVADEPKGDTQVRVRVDATSGRRYDRFRPRRLKLFDERALDTGVFVTASVTRGRLAWTRTEIYHGSSGQ
jgi:hypothetical protein